MRLRAQMLHHCATKFSVAFNSYDQSSHCEELTDSSVSYAAATVTAV
jgi:predicted class III extradiol MEMO1 family dioxygenase